MIVQNSISKIEQEAVYREKHPFLFRMLDLWLGLVFSLILWPLWLLHFLKAVKNKQPWLTQKVAMGKNQRTITYSEATVFKKPSFFNGSIMVKSPRLLAVLAGRLSLTGPPIISSETASSLSEAEKLRFAVRPGLINSHFIRSRTNIAFESEAELAVLDARAGLKTRLGLLLKAIPALVFGSEQKEASEHLTMFGFQMANLTQAQAVKRILSLSESSGTSRIAFVNPDCINIACKDEQYRNILEGNDDIYPDGIGLQIACKLLGIGMRDNLNGTDLFPAICREVQSGEHGLYFIGARKWVVEKMVENIKKDYPGLKVSGYRDGYFDEDALPEVIRDINQSGAKILLVAMGAPAQEKWIDKVLPELEVGVVLGVGGLFDFVSGRIPRAPIWMREVGLEWLYRLIREPRRLWRRYIIGNMVFFWNLARYGK